MACSSGIVDVVLGSLDNGDSPHCAHGPTLLFERYTDGTKRRFFACSACRDRKICSFFQWADRPLSKASSKSRAKAIKQQQKAEHTHTMYKQRLLEFKRLSVKQRMLCVACGQLLLPSEVKGHEGHSMRSCLSKADLMRPTRLLPALDNNKTNAQYLFSDATLNFIIKTLEDLKFQRILCIGAPRVHEEIQIRQKLKQTTLSSLLLDIDQRLEQFFNQRQFCRYNMFNHHFFRGKKAKRVYQDFVTESYGALAIIMDPPFGGLVEVLVHTLKKIIGESVTSNPEQPDGPGIFWIFPYFMEPRIMDSFPDFTMLDYKVEYDNHTVFSGSAKKSARGSPVRIFTNIPACNVPLPAEAYRYCKECERYVFKDIVHCAACNRCTSQDGRQYTHCPKCRRCVKPSWFHCGKCDACHLPDFNCQNPKTGCHICGAEDHKRRECPERFSKDRPDKRKRREENRQKRKKRRK